MILSIIGMSNSGKTYWAQKLEGIGFKRFSCDDFIEKKLEGELKSLGFSGVNDVAKWMGQPYDKQHSKTSKKYLDFEKESLNEIFRELKFRCSDQNIVIDTTGSVIYTGDKIRKELDKLTRIVYLETPMLVRQEMSKLYFQNPKPVLWGDVYKKKKGESDLDALKRCYPSLLDYRSKKYRKYAHLTLDYFLLRNPEFTVENFLLLLQGNDDFISEYQRGSQTL